MVNIEFQTRGASSSCANQGVASPVSCYTLGAAFLFLLGLILIGPSQYEIHKANQARLWKGEPAMITKSVVTHEGGRSNRFLAVSGTILSTGRQFSTRRIAYGSIGNWAAYEEYARRFPANKVAVVYVSPDGSQVILSNTNPIHKMYYLQLAGLGSIFLGMVPLFIRRMKVKRLNSSSLRN